MPPTDTTVTAAEATDTAADDLAPASGAVLAAEGRTISGCVLPWGAGGKTSAGELRFRPSAIRIPNDVSRIKLLRDHSPTGVPVGVATGWETKDDGLHMTFAIASTPDGDRALAEAAEHVRDSFSIEAAQVTRTGPDVTDSVLRAVALVPYPAFADARVETVSAAEALDDEDDEDDDGDDTTPDPATDDTEDTAMRVRKNTSATTPGAPAPLNPAVVPAGLGAAPAADTVVPFSEVVSTIMAVRSGAPVDEAHAALTDITNSAMLDAAPPAWLGELWSGVTYQRRIVPLLTQAPLRSWKAAGYRWATKPAVGKYAGDKAAIPSTAPTIEAVEVTAERWAGGNDIDRKFLDFNDTEFLAAYWRAMAESYAYETDQAAGQFLVANATAITPASSLDLIRAVTTAAIQIDQAVHSPATFVLLNPADLVSILNYAALDAPAFMGIEALSDPSRWTTSEFVPAGTAIVGAKPAVTHYELGGSPVRVEAEHIANGGRDGALFGYTALLLNRAEALVSIPFGAVTP